VLNWMCRVPTICPQNNVTGGAYKYVLNPRERALL